jgi:hypothetical protein
MISALEIKQKLSLVSMGKLSLNAFEDWLVPRAWNVHKDSSPEAIDLVSSIHFLFSERDDFVLSESDLHKELLSFLGNVIYVPVTIRDAFMPTSEIRWSARPSPLALASVQL